MNLKSRVLPVTFVAIVLLAILSPGTAFAKTIYEEYASYAGTPPWDRVHCATAMDPDTHQDGAYGCFEAHGDEFWIKDAQADGHHVEMRGVVNNSSLDGFRCYEYRGSDAGWLKCDSFWDNIPENHTLMWTIDVWEGSDLLYGSYQMYSYTS